MASQYGQHFKKVVRRITIPTIVAEMLLHREQDGASKVYLGQLRTTLNRFASLLRERDTLSVAEAVDFTGANRHTLKDKFGELVDAGMAELHGKGRGAHYRPAR